ncbi:MAG: hypothetical protein HY093_01810 [Candidatus Liptonbacteria bacterium]|nr:hypothetical protein [Candidatus Liptonbacteria bacterium]
MTEFVILTKEKLEDLYLKNKLSVPVIAQKLGCSEHKINYWLGKHNILKRTISEAVYLKYNPKGDPFKFNPPITAEDHELFGMGVGLYWGEGNKANKNIVKLGNSDSELLKVFIQFLIKFFNIKKQDLRFHLHIFTDINLRKAKGFWIYELGIKENQIYKPTITQTGKLGTYRHKSQYGVMTVYYANTKLRNLIVNLIPGNIINRKPA